MGGKVLLNSVIVRVDLLRVPYIQFSLVVFVTHIIFITLVCS